MVCEYVAKTADGQSVRFRCDLAHATSPVEVYADDYGWTPTWLRAADGRQWAIGVAEALSRSGFTDVRGVAIVRAYQV